MTYVIYKSKINISLDQLERIVREHAAELAQWTENMSLFEEEKGVPIPPEPQRANFETDEAFNLAYAGHHDAVAHRRQGYPPPTAHPEIDAAVARDGDIFTPDYRVVDDLPTIMEVPELRRLQDVYLSRVASAESGALNKLVPPGRIRAMEVRASDILSEDHNRVQEISGRLPGLQSEMMLLHNRILQFGEQITGQRVQLLNTQSQLGDLRNWALGIYHTRTEALAPQLSDAQAQLAALQNNPTLTKDEEHLQAVLEKRVEELEGQASALDDQDKANDTQLSELMILAQEQKKKLDELVQSSLETSNKIAELEQRIQEAADQLGDPAALHLLKRPAEDTEFLGQYLAIQQERDRITRRAVQITSDIEDLTEETAKSWVMEPLE